MCNGSYFRAVKRPDPYVTRHYYYRYVADNLTGTLGEFCRVLAPGGHAVLMLRVDDAERWAGAIEALERNGQWRRVDVTEPRDNFKNAPRSDEGGSEERIMYRIHTFQKGDRQLASRGGRHSKAMAPPP